MPRIAYETRNFRGDSLAIVQQASQIASEYAPRGYSLTLRQLYYQFVSRALIVNTDKSYKRLGEILSNARNAGLFDWDLMIDRTRGIRTAPAWDSPEQIVNASAEQYQIDLWSRTDQSYRPQVWVEKDALIGVIARPADELRVPYLSCRGYVSQSEMGRRGREIGRQRRAGYTPVVIHLGDHDPSGIDMTRDITDRLATYSEGYVEVRRVALTMEQIEAYDPPPNPTKLTDARAEGYVERYGYESWELDALDPAVIDALVRDTVSEYVDQDAWDEGLDTERAQREQMGNVAGRWDEISDRWSEIEELLS